MSMDICTEKCSQIPLIFSYKNFSSILIELFPYTPVPSGWYSTIKSFSNIKMIYRIFLLNLFYLSLYYVCERVRACA